MSVCIDCVITSFRFLNSYIVQNHPYVCTLKKSHLYQKGPRTVISRLPVFITEKDKGMLSLQATFVRISGRRDNGMSTHMFTGVCN